MKTIKVTFSDEDHLQLKLAAVSSGVPLSQLTHKFITEALKSYEGLYYDMKGTDKITPGPKSSKVIKAKISSVEPTPADRRLLRKNNFRG